MTGDYSQQYARFHPDDPGHRNGLTLLHRRMLQPHLPADRRVPILDVGCGRGYALEDLRDLGYTHLAGIDPDPGQVAHALARGLDVQQVGPTEEFLASKRGQYAAILLMDVLEHVPRDRQPGFLRVIGESLRPGGRLICTVPNAASGIAAYWLYNDATHQHSFTPDSLSFLLGSAGFPRVVVRDIEFVLRPRWLFWFPSPRTLRWWMLQLSRCRRRMELIGELGWERGRHLALTPNLLAIADRPAG